MRCSAKFVLRKTHRIQDRQFNRLVGRFIDSLENIASKLQKQSIHQENMVRLLDYTIKHVVPKILKNMEDTSTSIGDAFS